MLGQYHEFPDATTKTAQPEGTQDWAARGAGDAPVIFRSGAENRGLPSGLAEA
jgi:hypothetical protein